MPSVSWPNVVLIIPNLASIGRRIASPTVAKERAVMMAMRGELLTSVGKTK